MDYLSTILAFVSGGGISTIISLKFARKSNKVDFADKAIHFMEEQNDKMIKRVKALEKRIDDLEEISCLKIDCTGRVKVV